MELLTFDKAGYVRATCQKEIEDEKQFKEYMKLERFLSSVRSFEKEFKGKKVFKRQFRNSKYQGFTQTNWAKLI